MALKAALRPPIDTAAAGKHLKASAHLSRSSWDGFLKFASTAHSD